MSRAPLGRGLLWAGVLWFAGASAHHNAAAHYFTDRKTSIEGVVTQFRLINPHARLYFSVTTAQGQSESWIAEGDAASVLTRRGWKGDEIKRGDRVKIVGHPARDGSKMIEWTTLELPDGRVLGGGNGINDERKKQLEELERRRRGSQPATPAPSASSTSPSTTTTPTKSN